MTAKVDSIMGQLGYMTHDETMTVFVNILDEVMDEAALAEYIKESVHDAAEVVANLED